MQTHLDDELKKLNTDILKMATLTEEAIHKSVESLKLRDKNLAAKTICEDEAIDAMEVKIEEEIIDLLALFQPMAKDLRFITTALHINAELERIADLTVNISQRVLELADLPLLKPLIDIPHLAEKAKLMVRHSIDAFVREDQELAKEVIFADQEVNKLRNLIMTELIHEYMVKDGRTSPQAVLLLLVARDLERISDHASAIAEDIIYMIQARIIKHHREILQESGGEEKSDS